MTKKVTKKFTKRTPKKKQTRKKGVHVTEISDIDDFVKVVNKVQVSKKTEKILLKDSTISHIIENIMKDSGLPFKKNASKEGLAYTIDPNFTDVNIDVDVDELEDEFLEEGQLF